MHQPKKKYNEAYKKKPAAQHSLVILKNECQSLHNTRDAILLLLSPVWLWKLEQALVGIMEDADSKADLEGASPHPWIFSFLTKQSGWKCFL